MVDVCCLLAVCCCCLLSVACYSLCVARCVLFGVRLLRVVC